MEFINKENLEKIGFKKRLNLYSYNGYSVCLFKGHTWMISTSNCEIKDVNTIDDILKYMENPEKDLSNKVRF